MNKTEVYILHGKVMVISPIVQDIPCYVDSICGSGFQCFGKRGEDLWAIV